MQVVSIRFFVVAVTGRGFMDIRAIRSCRVRIQITKSLRHYRGAAIAFDCPEGTQLSRNSSENARRNRRNVVTVVRISTESSERRNTVLDWKRAEYKKLMQQYFHVDNRFPAGPTLTCPGKSTRVSVSAEASRGNLRTDSAYLGHLASRFQLCTGDWRAGDAILHCVPAGISRSGAGKFCKHVATSQAFSSVTFVRKLPEKILACQLGALSLEQRDISEVDAFGVCPSFSNAFRTTSTSTTSRIKWINWRNSFIELKDWR